METNITKKKTNFFSLFKTWAKMIKLEHTLFSLPFVFISALSSLEYMKNNSENFSFNGIVFFMDFSMSFRCPLRGHDSK